MSFMSLDDRNEHITTTHTTIPTTLNNSVTPVNLLREEVKDLPNQSSMTTTKDLQEKKATTVFTCDLCEYTAPLNKQLSMHILRKHPTGSQLLKCDLCNYSPTS